MQYITMYGQMAAQSNTMIFSDRPADVNALMAQAAAIMNNVPGKATDKRSASSIKDVETEASKE